MADSIKDELGAPNVVDRSTFQAEIDALQVREKAHTREGDAISAARRRLPMVVVDPAITLIGLRGPLTLLAAFEGRRQLIAYYFMWHTGHPAPEQFANCPTFTLATSPSLCSVRDRMKRAPAIAILWAGRCPGTRP